MTGEQWEDLVRLWVGKVTGDDLNDTQTFKSYGNLTWEEFYLKLGYTKADIDAGEDESYGRAPRYNVKDIS